MNLKKVSKGVLYIGALTLLLVGYQNCGSDFAPGFENGGGSSSGGLSPEEFAALQNASLNILATRCGSCHAGRLSDPVPNVYDLVEMKAIRAIVPGAPQMSGAYVAIIDGAMPPSGGVTSSERSTLGTWIQWMPK